MTKLEFRTFAKLLGLTGFAVLAASSGWADAHSYLSERRALNGVAQSGGSPRTNQANLIAKLAPKDFTTKLKAPATVNDALAVLRETPLNPNAMAIVAIANPETLPGVNRTLALQTSSEISRRTAFAQLVQVDRAIARRDLNSALASIDRLLLANPQFASDIFPRLILALDEPGGSAWIVSRLERPWSVPFLQYAVRHTQSWRSISDLILAARDHESERGGVLLAPMIEKIISEGSVSEAQVFAATYLDTDLEQIQRFPVSRQTLDRRIASLSWKPNEQYLTTQSDNIPAALSFEIPSGQNAVLLSRYTALRPGTYTIRYTWKADADLSKTRLTWMLTCLDSGTETEVPHLDRMTNSGIDSQLFVNIDQACRSQVWTIIVDNMSLKNATNVEIRSIRLYFEDAFK